MTDRKHQADDTDLVERMVRVETKVDEGFKQLHDCIDRVAKKVDETNKAMNGAVDSPGILVKLALLEAAQERRRWFNRVVVGALVTLTLGAIYAALN